MNIFVVNFIICSILAYIIYLGSSDKKSLKDRRFYIITFSILFVLHGFLDPDTLPDIPVYKNVFDRLASKPLSAAFTDSEMEYGENFEVLFKFLLSVVGHIWQNIAFFLFLYSFVICTIYFKFLKKYSPYFGLSVLLFIVLPFNQSIFVLRQHLSIAILLLSYEYIIERKVWRFLFLVTLATLFHTSSLVFYPVYFLYGIRSRKILLLMFLGGVFFTFAVREILSLAAVVMENNERYSGYAADGEASVATKGLIMLPFLLLFIMYLKEHILDDGINRLVFVISTCGTILYLVMGEVGGARLFLSYHVILLLQIPIIVAYMKSKPVRYLFVSSTLVALAVFAYYLSVTSEFLSPMRLLFLN